MARYAITRNSDGLVVNVCEWDGSLLAWVPPLLHTARLTETGNKGDTWNGTTYIPPVEVPVSTLKELFLADQFLAGNTTGQIGSLGWTTSGGTTAHTSVEADDVGVLRRSTGTTINTIAGMMTPSTAGTGFNPSRNFEMVWTCRLVNFDANTICRIGASSGAVNLLQPVAGAYFEKLAADTTWFMVVRNAGVQTRVATNINIVGLKRDLLIRRASPTQFAFVFDGQELARISTNLPTAVLNPWNVISNTAAAAKVLDIDAFSLQATI